MVRGEVTPEDRSVNNAGNVSILGLQRRRPRPGSFLFLFNDLPCVRDLQGDCRTVFLAFDFVKRLAFLDLLRGRKSLSGAEVFLHGIPNRCRQRSVRNGLLGRKHCAIFGDVVLDVLALYSRFHIEDRFAVLLLLVDLPDLTRDYS